MPRRLRIGVIYGGRSGEHEVSIESAQSVLQAIDRGAYDVVPIGITHEGAWHVVEPTVLLQGGAHEAARLLPSADPSQRALVPVGSTVAQDLAPVDVVFPLVHGPYGEDGCLQGLLELAGVPYVGSSVLGSAVGMDKIMMKTVFVAHGLPVVPHIAVARSAWEREPERVAERAVRDVGFPCFVKPANLGSSVGISKVYGLEELPAALGHAAQYGERLLVEHAVSARELECGVLGNDHPAASVVGEVIPHRDFYDYEAKYYDPETEFVVPADIPDPFAQQVQALAVEAFKAIGAAGMARVDFFLSKDDESLYVNEINTIPGFTAMSMYPRLWEASGVSYPELIDRLIALAMERHRDRARNKTRYER